MIDTIFYFAPDSFDEEVYRSNLDSEDGVSSRTIVFSPALKAIYKGGIRYGSMSIDDIKQYITQIIQSDPTVIGDNTESYDDSAIRSLIDAERDRINLLLANMDQSIINKMNLLFSDKDWLNTNVLNKIQVQSNFGDEDVDVYLQRIGLYTKSGNTRTWAWSSITQDVNSILSEVNQIKSNQQTGGQIDYELLASNVYQYINENAASAGLSSTWGKFMQLSGGDLQRLSWVTTAIDEKALDDKGVLNIFTAALEYSSSGKEKLNLAYSGVLALVEKDQNDNWVASGRLSTMINDKVSAITTLVHTDGLGHLLSNVTITADNINLNGIVEQLLATGFRFGEANKYGFQYKAGNLAGGTSTALWGGVFNNAGELPPENVNFEISYTSRNNHTGPIITLKEGGEESWISGGGGMLHAKIMNSRIYDNNGLSSYLNVGGDGSMYDIYRTVRRESAFNDSRIWSIDTNTTSPTFYPVFHLSKVNTSNGANTETITLSGLNGDITASGDIEAYDITAGRDVIANGNVTSHADIYADGNIAADGTITSSNGVCQGSDVTKKDIIANTTLTVDQIADAPSIQFTWKKDTDKIHHVGTSAQYWLTVMPEVIMQKNDTMFMDYSSTALVSAITIAKEVVSLKEEIALLRQQIAELQGNNNE